MTKCFVIYLVFIVGLTLIDCEKLLYCKISGHTCTFSGRTVDKDEKVSIVADHSNTRNEDIKLVIFESSSIYYVPPEIFSVFPNLEHLEMVNANVHEILNDTFLNAKSLNFVNLNYNKIKHITSNTFYGADRLQHILIIFNKSVVTVDKHSFDNFFFLENVDLGDNLIQTVHKELYSKLFYLKRVSLADNRLQYLHKDLFKQNHHLEIIYLHGNKFNALSNTMFSHLPKLDMLTLDRNHCVNVSYRSSANTQLEFVENDLRNCAVGYLIKENDEIMSRLDSLDNVINVVSNDIKKIRRSLQIYD